MLLTVPGCGNGRGRVTESTSGAPRQPLLDRLRAGPIALDAAMGTRLMAAGLDPPRDDAALWNLTHAEAVLRIHEADAAAGAQALVTNTFGANRPVLERFGRGDALGRIVAEAVRLARESGGPDAVYLLGSIAPTVAGLRGAAREAVRALEASQVDALLFETFTAETIVPALDELGERVMGMPPIFVSLWTWPEQPAKLLAELVDRSVAAVGMNCRPGMEEALAFARALAAHNPRVPLFVKPSAAPAAPDSSPAAFARAVPELVALGVRMIGGCCGTNADHVHAVRNAVDRLAENPCQNSEPQA